MKANMYGIISQEKKFPGIQYGESREDRTNIMSIIIWHDTQPQVLPAIFVYMQTYNNKE